MSLPMMGIALVILAVLTFPVISFYGKTLVLFAPDQVSQKVSQRVFFDGRVLGSHTFETEYGEITLNHFANILSQNNTIGGIEPEVFLDGTGFHNLVIEGIEIPKQVFISFEYDSNQISGLVLEYQEITVSGIPISPERLVLGHEESGADVAMIGASFPRPHITLVDSTDLNMEKFFGRLYIYKDSGQWKLEIPRLDSYFLVKLPGETEFTRYKSITFGENWGGFIEGELFEEQQ